MIDTNNIRRMVRDHEVSAALFALCDEIDRLRAKPKPQGKTVRVRIPIMVDHAGNAQIGQYCRDSDGKEYSIPVVLDGGAKMIITADLPIPEETIVEAEVENANND